MFQSTQSYDTVAHVDPDNCVKHVGFSLQDEL